jgi:hypothetical protein
MGLAKTLSLTERIRLVFEATFTNLPNHPNFAPPFVDVSSPATLRKDHQPPRHCSVEEVDHHATGKLKIGRAMVYRLLARFKQNRDTSSPLTTRPSRKVTELNNQ